MDSLTTQLIDLGVTPPAAKKISSQIERDLKKSSPEQCWQQIVNEIAKAHYPFSVHELLYKTIYPDFDHLPAPAWLPEEKEIKATHIASLMREKNLSTYEECHRWSFTRFEEFWQTMIDKLHIQFDKPYQKLVDLSSGIETPNWFPGAKMNIARSCFNANPADIAIISKTEHGEHIKVSYDELNKVTNRIANRLHRQFKKGDKIAIIMPMTYHAVAIYLAVIKVGLTVVAIPDSFAAEEIATRFQISDTKAVFCQDRILRDGKSLPLYERIKKANAPLAIVIPVEKTLQDPLRKQDIHWDDFLDENENFTLVSCDPDYPINILFSSGTTGTPKAIPWTHTSPIKAASDAYLHHNICEGDIFCWPTNLGWMMGPWLIFACLINKATIALFDGSPNGENFGNFINEIHITHLGVVPTLVKTWRAKKCMEAFDFSAIKLFTSTGERSNAEDMLYLMYLANYRPIIEYRGGTEIAGAYITGTLVQPCAPASFTTPALGLDFVIIDEHGKLTNNGEIALIPPSIGLSTTLLNKDHHEIYYADMPTLNEKTLRRHGDQVERYPNGFYRLLGRVDDTMKLGGIKISSAEIEIALNKHPSVYETAAVAFNPKDGGPSQLIIYTVPKNKSGIDEKQLKTDMQNIIKEQLNPLFKIHAVIMIETLPRTASNKIMRRVLRDEYMKSQHEHHHS